jgi:hypothetical protein
MEIVLELVQREPLNRDSEFSCGYENYTEEDFQRESAILDAIIADELQDFLSVKAEVEQIILDAAKFGIPILEGYHFTVVTDDNTGHDFQVVNLEFRKNKIFYLLQYV